MILLIDNYDSFVYNLMQYSAEVQSAEVQVFRNDQISIAEITALSPSHIIISPGPCGPRQAGISLSLVAEFAGRIPMLGVCLGHQVIAECFGGKVVRAKLPVHGKPVSITNDGKGVFQNLEKQLTVARYHSLLVERSSLPECFEVSATSSENEIMAIRHRVMPNLCGLQFHPESIMTPAGKELLDNFFRLTS